MIAVKMQQCKFANNRRATTTICEAIQSRETRPGGRATRVRGEEVVWRSMHYGGDQGSQKTTAATALPIIRVMRGDRHLLPLTSNYG